MLVVLAALLGAHGLDRSHLLEREVLELFAGRILPASGSAAAHSEAGQ